MTDAISPVRVIEHEYPVEDYQSALQYLLWREERKRMSEIAELLGVTVRAVYWRIDRWAKNGALEAARTTLSVPKLEEVAVAIDRAINAFPAILDHQISLAKGAGKSELVSLQAAQWIEQLIRPALENKTLAGVAESVYASKLRDFTPLTLESGIQTPSKDAPLEG